MELLELINIYRVIRERGEVELSKRKWGILIIGLSVICILVFIGYLSGGEGAGKGERPKSKVLKGIGVETKKENELYQIVAEYPKTKNKNINQFLEDYTDGEIAAYKVNYSKNKGSSLYQSFDTYCLSNNIISFKFELVISSKEEKESFTRIETKNFNSKTGEILYIKDIMKNTTSLNKLSEIVYDKLSQEKVYKREGKEDSILKKELATKEENFENFILEESKIVFYFRTYQTNSNSIYSLAIPLSELEGVIKEEYQGENIRRDDLEDNKMGKSLTDKKLVALTFDDGPNPGTTTRLLSILKKENVPATFFVLGNRVQLYPEIVREAYQGRNQIGSHTYSHLNLPELPIEEVKKEIEMTKDIVKQTIGKYPSGTRPPYGAVTPQIISIIDSPIIQWSVDSLDWQSKNADHIEQTVLSEVYDGSIILMHDIYETSVDGAQKVITDLKKRGYTFVTVNQLIESRELLERGKQYFDAVK